MCIRDRFMEEEDTFWMMCAIIEDLLPASYYSSTLIGIQVHCNLYAGFDLPPMSGPLFGQPGSLTLCKKCHVNTCLEPHLEITQKAEQ